MKGLIRKAMIVGCLAAGLISTTGCYYRYNDLVDPCWPQRYIAPSREEVRQPFQTQINNGLVLEQTVWNHHFDTEQVQTKEGELMLRPSNNLNAAGKLLLDRLARRRPAPIMDVFVQTAHDTYDIPLDTAKPEEYRVAKENRDRERVKSVQAYLDAIRPDLKSKFNLAVHDPARVGLMPAGTLRPGQGEAERQVIGLHTSAQGAFAPGTATRNQFAPSTTGVLGYPVIGGGGSPGTTTTGGGMGMGMGTTPNP